VFGFGPLSYTSVSGPAFKLIAVPLALAATASFEFAVSARAGFYSSMAARIGITFDGSPFITIRQHIGAIISFGFDGNPNLRLAGKPIIISAVPTSYTVRATNVTYALKALPEQFTLRGVR
jgi:hypothetical protein